MACLGLTTDCRNDENVPCTFASASCVHSQGIKSLFSPEYIAVLTLQESGGLTIEREVYEKNMFSPDYTAVLQASGKCARVWYEGRDEEGTR